MIKLEISKMMMMYALAEKIRETTWRLDDEAKEKEMKETKETLTATEQRSGDVVLDDEDKVDESMVKMFISLSRSEVSRQWRPFRYIRFGDDFKPRQVTNTEP
jgi:hypothetical protein